jgi:phenylpyruvate tautomerase PptA (4-oxalocrotonate tautomerase family)
MPFVHVNVNVPVSPAQEAELKRRFGRAIAQVPGKSEQYLLLCFHDRCRLWLRGDNETPIAYVEASIFGNEDHRGFDRFASGVTAALGEVLGVPAENVYIKFDDISVWSAGSCTFDRADFR